MIEQFADDLYLNEKVKISLSDVIKKFEVLARLGQNYFVKETRDFCILSDALENIKGFSLHD